MSKSSVIEKSVQFIKPYIDAKLNKKESKPIVVGVEGPQGSGKSYTSSRIKQILSNEYPACNIIQFSMDDFYLTYAEQVKVNADNEKNILLQGRGLPGTHDVPLLLDIFRKLLLGDKSMEEISIPVYDKSAHNGKGDRQRFESWLKVKDPVDVIIFEGWFNGYIAVPNDKQLIALWDSIKAKYHPKFENISNHNIIDVNNNLKKYESIWNLFDLFICIKTPNINNVYKWRLQQERELIKQKGKGMTDDQVEKFIDRYMPMYYLYYNRLELFQQKIKSLEVEIDESRDLLSKLKL